MADTTSTTGGTTFIENPLPAVTITIAEPEPEPPTCLPAIPAGGLTVVRSWRYVQGCPCDQCRALRDGRLYWRNDSSLVPGACLTRNAPHEYDKIPPEPNTEEWRERSARGSKLLRGLLVGEQLKVWDRFRALIIRYKKPYPCGCDSCDSVIPKGTAGLLLTPEDNREFGRWEFNTKGGLVHKRNLWTIDQGLWSYEDELISLLLAHRGDPVEFIGTGCRDHAPHHKENSAYRRASRIMRRIMRFPDATKAMFALADEPGMFAGVF